MLAITNYTSKEVEWPFLMATTRERMKIAAGKGNGET